MERKYHVTRETHPTILGVYRIIALMDIPEKNVRKGDLGGFVGNEANLSQYGSAWVAEEAVACGNSYVSGDSLIRGKTIVMECAVVRDEALIDGECLIGGQSRIRGRSTLRGRLFVGGTADITLAIGQTSTLGPIGTSRVSISGWRTLRGEYEFAINRVVYGNYTTMLSDLAKIAKTDGELRMLQTTARLCRQSIGCHTVTTADKSILSSHRHWDRDGSGYDIPILHKRAV